MKSQKEDFTHTGVSYLNTKGETQCPTVKMFRIGKISFVQKSGRNKKWGPSKNYITTMFPTTQQFDIYILQTLLSLPPKSQDAGRFAYIKTFFWLCKYIERHMTI